MRFSLDNITFYEIKNMLSAGNIRWIFDNAILENWMAYAGGILGIILIVMFGIGVAEESGLLACLIRKVGLLVSEKYLPYMIVFLGIMSNIATDAGYIILIPLAGLLYEGIGKNPLIGMAAAFAGVSAGFSANLIPATIADVVVGTNALAFCENQSIPFLSYLGKNINPLTMNYYFFTASTALLVIIGGTVTNKIIKPRLEKSKFIDKEDNENKEKEEKEDFAVSKKENKALKMAGLGLLLSIIICLVLYFFPLKNYIDGTGKKITPFLDNIILIVTFIFFICGAFYGFASGKFKNVKDIVSAMAKHVGQMGYVIVLTFFCYNFLALLTYSNIGTYITYIGASALIKIGAAGSPYILLLGFIAVTAIINLFVGGLSSKWMLLGPIFIPMLYRVNNSLTPDIISAAYRLADSSTNVITPLMSYAGIILLYMRKYMPKLNLGGLISLMMPYSAIFLVIWTLFLFIFIWLKIPLGF